MLGIGKVAVNPQQMQQQQQPGQQQMRPGQQQAPIPPANRYEKQFSHEVYTKGIQY